MTTPEPLSTTMRDYLVQIYTLSERTHAGEFVSTSDLADALMVSAPAVNRMVTKLREMGLLLHERYQGIVLTEEGKREALKQLRRQRIVETFLVEVMDFGWHEVAHEAERMSATLGETLLTRMWEMAGKPAQDPHGEPIPNENGEFTLPPDVPLVNAAPEKHYTITRVTTHEADRLEYLAALGLKPNQTFKLLHIAPFNGPLQLQLGREYRIIGHNLAEIIHVVEAE